MKIKYFLEDIDNNINEEMINELSEKLNLSREYREYVNFEDNLNGVSENILHQNISPSESNLLPKRFLKKEEK